MSSFIRRLLAIGIVAAVVYFAVQGGEYTTTKLIAQRWEQRRTTREIDSLRRIVDSLTRYRRRLDTDPALQERIAREVFGMVKTDNELVYRFVAVDTSRRDTTRR